MDGIELREVNRQDCKFLYRMLEERPDYANISHKKMPTWREHISFVMSDPYVAWSIITYNGNKAGHTYITEPGEIGIFIKKEYQLKGIAKFIIKTTIRMAELMKLDLLDVPDNRKRLLANINPKNKASIKLFEGLGFKHIQNTYELEL